MPPVVENKIKKSPKYEYPVAVENFPESDSNPWPSPIAAPPAEAASLPGVPESPTKPIESPIKPPRSPLKDGEMVVGLVDLDNPDTTSIAEMMERKDLAMFLGWGGLPGFYKALVTDPQQGIQSGFSPEQRIEKFGANMLPPAEKVTFLGLVWEALGDTLLRMLIVAAVVSIILGLTVPGHEPCHMLTVTPPPYGGPYTTHIFVDGVQTPPDLASGWIEGTAILISVTVVVLVSTINDYKKAKKFEALDAVQSMKSVAVIRNGTKVEVDSTLVMVGDILLVADGSVLCADCLYIQGQDVKLDESAVTGEIDHVKKNATDDPFLISGTAVVTGECRAVVIAVGENSFNGIQLLRTREPAGDTPLQVKLSEMAETIGRFGSAAAVITLLCLIIIEVVNVTTNERYCFYQKFNYKSYLDFLIICIAIVVVAIPEGLPLAVTIALAFSMKKMMNDNCLVRHLAACETMGAGTAICSDKTGTLTQNKMTVVEGWIADDSFFDATAGVENLPAFVAEKEIQAGLRTAAVMKADETDKNCATPAMRNALCLAIAINSKSDEVLNKDGTKRWVGGNKTEEGMLRFIERFGCDYKTVRAGYTDKTRRCYPFNSEKKKMTTIVFGAPTDGVMDMQGQQGTIYVKGASEIILESCVSYKGINGENHEMTSTKRDVLSEIINEMARQGNRTLAIACAMLPLGTSFPDEEPDEPLTLIALLGIQDPIRPEVPGAVAQCQKAHVKVRMVTGDNITTAKSIATKCGIYQEGVGYAMEGKEFREMALKDPEQLRKIIPKLQVLARSSPGDKHVLAAALMDAGEVVAMTGDGTNDAPALKLSHVGFAMNSGTEIAQLASDIILLDDNFVSVVRACNWGRNVNDSVRKFIQFQLTVNVVGVLLTFIGAVSASNRHSPLSAVMLLWLNLIMDTFAALGLATESPSLAQLEREPVYRQAPLISRKMWSFIIGHAFYQLAINLAIIYDGHNWFNLEKDGTHHQTLLFNTFIWMQIWNQFNARKLYPGEYNPFEGMLRSKPFFGVFFIIVAFQVAAVELPGLQSLMGTTTLSGMEWLFCVCVSFVEFPLGLLIKAIPVTEPEHRPEVLTRQKAASMAKIYPEAGNGRASIEPVGVNLRAQSFRVVSTVRSERKDHGASFTASHADNVRLGAKYSLSGV